MSPSMRDLILTQNSREATKEDSLSVVKAITVAIDYTDNCAVAGKKGYAWVQELGTNHAYQVFNPSVKYGVNLPVLIQAAPKKPFRKIIVGVDWSSLASTFINDGTNPDDDIDTYSIVNHAVTHEWPDGNPGSDAITVHLRAISPLRTVPSTNGGLYIAVNSAMYMMNGIAYSFDGETGLDVSDHVPTIEGVSICMLVYLDLASNSIKVTYGPASMSADPERPDIPRNCMPSAYVVLYYGMTDITEYDIIRDVRVLFTVDNFQSVLNSISAAYDELDYIISKHIVEG
jgi:hypothetical protein